MIRKKILDANQIDAILDATAKAIAKDVGNLTHFGIVGVQTRGVTLAERIKRKIEEITTHTIPLGILDITFYRDDLSKRGVLPMIKETRIHFNIEKMTILLVDDVIYTGRTAKAALESLMSFGRPSIIRLFALIDRGNRELPIQPDYCGFAIATKISDTVQLCLREIDGEEDAAYLLSNGE
ncbi:MAG: bifunctional pyr operon transcriptional regulator/uracil phosphoribosyltransferase PyrR [Spirochaetes bacterium]|nr:bifunctional pyr operon transcriptional regulator/uracil phosphoribosyltransferase PyrR [Spirochaetota bacterium]